MNRGAASTELSVRLLRSSGTTPHMSLASRIDFCIAYHLGKTFRVTELWTNAQRPIYHTAVQQRMIIRRSTSLKTKRAVRRKTISQRSIATVTISKYSSHAYASWRRKNSTSAFSFLQPICPDKHRSCPTPKIEAKRNTESVEKVKPPTNSPRIGRKKKNQIRKHRTSCIGVVTYISLTKRYLVIESELLQAIKKHFKFRNVRTVNEKDG